MKIFADSALSPKGKFLLNQTMTTTWTWAHEQRLPENRQRRIFLHPLEVEWRFDDYTGGTADIPAPQGLWRKGLSRGHRDLELLGRWGQRGLTSWPAHTAATELCLPSRLLRAVVMSSKDALPLPATSIKNIWWRKEKLWFAWEGVEINKQSFWKMSIRTYKHPRM